MKPHLNTQAARTIGQLLLAACIALMPEQARAQAAAVPAPAGKAVALPAKAQQRSTLVGYDRSIVKEHFKGLGAQTVLRMQQHLQDIYGNLADWKTDPAVQRGALKDGIVGGATLTWLQRYAFNFKFVADDNVGKEYPAHMERMAAFARSHPAELAILLDRQFAAWDEANPAPIRQQDFDIRRRASEAALIELVKRYQATLGTTASGTDSDVFYTYALHKEDLAALGGKGALGTILAKFKDKPYRSKETLKVALEPAFKDRPHALDEVWPVIATNLKPYNGYMLNPANYASLKKDGVSAGTLVELNALGTLYLKTDDAFNTYITEKIASGELTISDEAIGMLATTTRVFDNFHLDQQALDTIAKELSGSVHYIGLPAVVVKMLGQIEGVEYPDAEIFHSAAKSKFAHGLGMCSQNTPVSNLYIKTLAITEDELASLKKEMEALHAAKEAFDLKGETIAEQFPKIATLRHIGKRCSDEEINKADHIVGYLYNTYLKPPVDSAGRKTMPDAIEPIRIQGGDCGCALDDLAGVVYGFYPYWRAKQNKQTINFRALNRVAYYGLTVDHTGDFRLGSSHFPINDRNADPEDFQRVARQYNSSVDWLIQKTDWSGDWKAMKKASKEAVFNNLLKNISLLLNTPLSNFGAQMKRLTTIKGDPPRLGDGVTLYFPNYPTDEDSKALFNAFYLELRAEMARNNLWLNILVSQNTLLPGLAAAEAVNGAFGMANLVYLRQKRGDAPHYIALEKYENKELLLVLLNEPSADSKKRLRRAVENDSLLSGARRADFVRSMVPVLHFDNNDWQQLDDDIVYARDNFGGVGFWAPDMINLAESIKGKSEKCIDSKHIAACVLSNYREPLVSESVPGPVEAFVCVHRWALHWVMLFLIVTGFVLLVSFFTSCKVQGFIKNHFLWVQLLVAAPALLVFMLLLMYDPYMLSLSKGNLPFFISAGVIMAGIGLGYWFWRSQRRVPQRERGGMPQRQGAGFPILVWTIEHDKGGFQWLIKNRGTGYAIIKRVEILLDGNPVADAKTALESVMESDNNVLWKTIPLVGQKLDAGKQLVGLSIANEEAAQAFAQKLKAHDLAVQITYSGPNNEHWSSDGSGIMSVSGVA